MGEEFSRDILKNGLAKILQTIGWHSIQTTPLDVLLDILIVHLRHLGKITNDYANEFGCSEPNLDHLGLAFRDLRIDVENIQDYVKYVDFGQSPTPVPNYPIGKEDHLNFLKPGSKEVVTRPVHIHEHLPPMNIELESTDASCMDKEIKEEDAVDCMCLIENTPVFKRPAEVCLNEPFKRPRLLIEEEGRPTREISSVMMTTSGYLSPAREGKLPESRTPLSTIETSVASNSFSSLADATKKLNKIPKKIDKKKDKGVGKELFKLATEDKKVKTATMKDVAKLKQIKTVNANNLLQPIIGNFFANNEVKIPTIVHNNNTKLPPVNNNKINKALAAARLKTEKLNTTITPVPIKPTPTPPPVVVPLVPIDTVDKLFTEPDKRKVNIFKRISNVKNEKNDNKTTKVSEAPPAPDFRENSPDLIIDETPDVVSKVHHISNDITIELINASANSQKNAVKIEKPYFEDESPPGTPSTPKTPEMISQSPPLAKEKRKRKDKSKIKKVQKQVSPNRIDSEALEVDLERPKTPEARVPLKQEVLSNGPPGMPFPFFTSFTAGPGLIPPLNNPLFPRLSLPTPGFGQTPYLPPVHPGISINMLQPQMKIEEPPPPKTPEEKPLIIEPETTPPPPEQISPKSDKKVKEHKKEKKDKIKKKNKKDKIKDKAEKKKLKEEKKDKEKGKKEKKEKRKEKERESEISVPKLTLKLGSASPHPDPERKLNIKPILRKEEEEKVVQTEREMSPELAKISALVTGQPKPKSTIIPKEELVKDDPPPAVVGTTPRPHQGPGRPRIHPIKSKRAPKNKRQVPIKDSEGNEVWICPACGRQDDGSPMIGCDDCDAWYHWVCVGIQVPPDDNENWYCRLCIVKKQEVLQTEKKKKRKRKEKKDY